MPTIFQWLTHKPLFERIEKFDVAVTEYASCKRYIRRIDPYAQAVEIQHNLGADDVILTLFDISDFMARSIPRFATDNKNHLVVYPNRDVALNPRHVYILVIYGWN